jgi:Nucleotidyltransferase/DNA polymerase involved in DNA repair
MLNKTIFHIDVNSAFLSWSTADLMRKGETLDLRTVPSAIGGDSNSRRGIILAKSIPAKKYGIVTGEPVVSALKKCPFLIVIQPNFKLYNSCSNQLFNLLSNYSDRLEIFSIDECFLDYTGMEKLFGTAEDAAHEIKERIKTELCFTVNIGIGPNKLLAKMAGELEKPDKVITLYPNEIEEKLWPLPVSELFMVGRSTSPRLNRLGIYTIGQLANYNYAILEKEFKSYAHILKNYANGIADDIIAPFGHSHTYKSISNSTTTPKDVFKKEDAFKVLLALCENVGKRLRYHGQFANSISVTVKTNEFKVYSHQKQLNGSTDCTNIIYSYATKIFDSMWKKEPLRHLGVSADKLTDDCFYQLSFIEENREKQRKAENAIDTINKKFGNNTVKRCTLMDNEIKVAKGSTFSKDISNL